MELSSSLAIAKFLGKPTIEATSPFFKQLTDGISHWYKDGFKEYFDNTLKKYKEIKTLLHRQPTPFYDVYYPASLLYNGQHIEIPSLKVLFQNTNTITVIGDAGSGKSTLLTHLFISALYEGYKAPIFVALRDLNIEDSNLSTYIRRNILQNKLSPSDTYLNKLLEQGAFIFFLDGYDEIKSALKHEITVELESFVDKYSKNSFILTSRPNSNIEYFKRFHNYTIQELSQEDMKLFVKQQITDTLLSTKIVESLEENTFQYIDSYLKNPLLLTLYILTYRKNSSIPSNKYIFYRRVFDVLFAEHDSASKVGFEREFKTSLNQEQFEYVLKLFSFLSFFENEFDFDKDYIFEKLNQIKNKNLEIEFSNNNFLDDMKLTIGLWTEDSGIYSFAHRSMQEYFAAVYVSNVQNVENKIKIYSKILSSFEKYQNPFSLNNFLSLCYEMDETFYIEHYALPILQQIRRLFKDDAGSYVFELPYISAGFTCKINKTQENSIVITDELMFLINVFVTPTMTFDYPFSILLPVFAAHISDPEINNFFDIRSRQYEEENDTYEFNFKEDNVSFSSFSEYLTKIGITEKLDIIVSRIDQNIADLKSKVQLANTIENDFIDMI